MESATRNPTISRNGSDQHIIEDEYNFHDSSFRRHYQLHYADSGNSYDFYSTAYRFGYELAEEHGGQEWSQVEGEAQRHWQTRHEGEWSSVAAAVRYGWEEARHPEQLRVHHRGQFEDYDEGFRTHFDETYPSLSTGYDYHMPAYQYGYALAIDPEYRTLTWEEMESKAEQRWAKEYQDRPWTDHRDAVRYAWTTVRTGA